MGNIQVDIDKLVKKERKSNRKPKTNNKLLHLINVIVIINLIVTSLLGIYNTGLFSGATSVSKDITMLSDMDVNKYISSHMDDIDEIYDLYTAYIGNKEIAIKLIQASLVYKIPLHKLLALVKHESNFNPNARNQNANGSVDVGLFQLNSATYSDIINKNGINYLYNIDVNIDLGVKHLLECKTIRSDKSISYISWYRAISTYNIGRVTKDTSIGYIEMITNYEKDLDFMFIKYVNGK